MDTPTYRTPDQVADAGLTIASALVRFKRDDALAATDFARIIIERFFDDEPTAKAQPQPVSVHYCVESHKHALSGPRRSLRPRDPSFWRKRWFSHKRGRNHVA